MTLQRRTRLRRKTGLARSDKPMRRTRSKRARPGEPLATWCEAGVVGVCTRRAQHRHHIVRRSQGGSDHWTNTMDVCRPCHRYIHANVAWAKAQGFLRSPGAPGGPGTPGLPAILCAALAEALALYVATRGTGMLSVAAAAASVVGLVAAASWWTDRPTAPAPAADVARAPSILDAPPPELAALLDGPGWNEWDAS